MPKPTPVPNSPQLFLEHKARHEFNLRRNRRNAARFVRALIAVGVGLHWDGKRLHVTGRLPARSRHHLSRLGVHVVRMMEALAAQEQHPASVPASTAIQ